MPACSVHEPLVAIDTTLGVGFARWAADVTSRISGHSTPMTVLEVYGFTATGVLEDVIMYRGPLDGEMCLLKGVPSHADSAE